VKEGLGTFYRRTFGFEPEEAASAIWEMAFGGFDRFLFERVRDSRGDAFVAAHGVCGPAGHHG
jgi:hypothetical protein